MKRHTKALSCLVISFIGLFSFYLYVFFTEPPSLALAFEKKEGNEQVIDDLTIFGDVFFSQPSIYNTYVYREGETTFEFDRSPLERLNSTYDARLDYYRQKYPNFMRNKGIFNAEILESDSYLVTLNYVGDYKLAYSSWEDEIMLGILDKETEEFTHYTYTTEHNIIEYTLWGSDIYEQYPFIDLLIPTKSEADGSFIHLSFNAESEEFNEEVQSFFDPEPDTVTNLLLNQSNASVTLVEKYKDSENISLVEREDFLLYNYETGSLSKLSMPDGEFGFDYLPIAFEDSAYLFEATDEQLRISKADSHSNNWVFLFALPLDSLSTNYSVQGFEFYTFDITDDMLTLTYPSYSEEINGDLLVIATYDLTSGEQQYNGTITLEHSDRFEGYTLELPTIYRIRN